MRSIRVIVMSLAVMAIASLVSAECLECFVVGRPPATHTECMPTQNPGYCSGDCCIDPSWGCYVPDFLYECGLYRASVNGRSTLPQQQALRAGNVLPDAYLTSPRLLQQGATPIYRRLGTLRTLARHAAIMSLFKRCTA
ncbi:MAG: hypothetical protein JWO56_2113 [Acidobacteria bacterium]|nr:hypothetical protein [Acidobacteriota bacterium]